MTNDPIRDRGLGPEIVGTRITVYNLLPHFVDSTATESSICRMYDLTRHLAIEAKMAARNPPEIIERAKQTHAAFLSFKDWLAKRQQAQAQEIADESTSGIGHTDSSRLPTFREWLAERELGAKTGRDMRGLLANVNVQGHLPYLRHLLETSACGPSLWS